MITEHEECFLIQNSDVSVYLQRKEPKSAMDDPLTDSEMIILQLCRENLKLQKT